MAYKAKVGVGNSLSRRHRLTGQRIGSLSDAYRRGQASEALERLAGVFDGGGAHDEPDVEATAAPPNEQIGWLAVARRNGRCLG